jgi:hypothetical protein
MNMRSLYLGKLAAANLTATAAGTEIDITKYFVSPARREMMATLTAFNGGGNVASDTYAIDVKLQESPTTVDSDFTDITGAAFTQITETATTGTPESIYFQTLAASKYIREYATITGGGGTATVACVCNAFLVKRNNG